MYTCIVCLSLLPVLVLRCAQNFAFTYKIVDNSELPHSISVNILVSVGEKDIDILL